MGLTDKVSELANYFSNNFDKVKELPTSLAGSITSAATAVPKAPMFSQSSAKEDDPYPNMIRTIEDMWTNTKSTTSMTYKNFFFSFESFCNSFW